ncbi:L-serine ammonia-lyase [Mycobacterium antarcticum]|uniref:L-serine ammonia-lyase n=1 Tax=unclassified Mycolicibacterium TaxID=2636767 RepID=UPI00238460D2|nr:MULTISPECIES: L-serine ammonia-lyase [unclassified Mycolicibacterium]BDX33639.1 L-serine ammonia-lyase [Mycolicibacterium sp. TUM20985]GLP76808.1 L-serine ammonia-lyase [Mycolicibacterium sp. TUM20983]GLP82752.1 L-serine ammonia-lyase [Mycolicibacterium sp. TUM20984]
MTISVFELFSIGIGPSSSHTVGPMRAAKSFADEVALRAQLEATADVRVDLFGSLAATGSGHGTMAAILLGLEGFAPETIDTDEMERRLQTVREQGRIQFAGSRPVPLTEAAMVLRPLTFHKRHANAMTFTALDEHGAELFTQTYFSVGGGFIVTADDDDGGGPVSVEVPMAFGSSEELIHLADLHDLPISQIMLANECASQPESEVRARLLHIHDVMMQCQRKGIERTGHLPGTLGVRRRAHDWHERLVQDDPDRDVAFAEDWVNLVALAVNEENASGGRVVTAPTNGAAGIIPAVLHYALHYTPPGRQDPDDVVVRFLLTAGAIGSLFKQRASISGAEVGCQGEVGSAAAMAAAALAEILGGTTHQVENAAEIAMEHSLGLTCDPIAGLVQIPCIERNAISAGKAINAARMALRGDGIHRVSLDQVIETMRVTGVDMSSKYKETSTGGLAMHVPVNLVEC